MVEIALTSFTEAKLTTSDVLFWDKHLTLMNWNQSEHYFAFWMKSNESKHVPLRVVSPYYL